jgi:4-amino-4-deoxy-L-arabinose transferase-like glycosyltransferase
MGAERGASRRSGVAEISSRLVAVRWVLLAIVVAALALRLETVREFQAHHPQAEDPVIDEASYDRWARAIAAGDWLGSGIFFQEPLYPYVLGGVYAVFGDSRALARNLQAGLGALTALLVFALARPLFGPAAALLAACGWALYRPGLWFPTLLLKENLFLPVLLAFALVLLRASSMPPNASAARRLSAWALAGLLAGLGALLRGNLLVLIPCFALWPFVRVRREPRGWGRAAAAGLALLLGALVALLPVAVRNQAVGGRFVLTTSGTGTNFYGGNTLDNPYGKATEFAWVRGVPEYEADDWRHEAERRLGRPLDAQDTSSYWLGETLRSFREHPREHLGVLWNKLRLTLGNYEVPDNHFLEWDARFVPILRGPWPGFGWIGTLGLAGLAIALWRGRLSSPLALDRGRTLELACLFALYLLTIVLTVTSERARLPLVVLLLPFAALAVLELARLLRTVAGVGAGAGALAASRAACLALSACLVLTPALPAAERSKDFEERDYNRASGLLRSGDEAPAPADLELAGALAAELDARHPGSPRVGLLLANIAYQRARVLQAAAGAAPSAAANELITGALDRLRASSERANPRELYQIHLLAGAIQQYLGQFEGAVAHYRLARRFDPEDPDLLRRLAVCLANAAMAGPAGEARQRGLREAVEILKSLAQRRPSREIEQLLRDIEGSL